MMEPDEYADHLFPVPPDDAKGEDGDRRLSDVVTWLLEADAANDEDADVMAPPPTYPFLGRVQLAGRSKIMKAYTYVEDFKCCTRGRCTEAVTRGDDNGKAAINNFREYVFTQGARPCNRGAGRATDA
jgi:hypothetical protein